MPFVTRVHGQVSWIFMVISPPIQGANIGIADSLIVMVIALVVLGPRRLPEVGRKVGKLMYEFRKASNDFKFQMEEELRASEEAEKRKALEARQAEDHKRLLALEAAVKKPEENAPADATAAVASVSEPAVLEPSPTEAAPSIKPPSTGAPVQATRPSGFIDAANAMAEMAVDSALNPLPPAQPNSSEEPEPTTKHG